jgi:hypothetical protein
VVEVGIDGLELARGRFSIQLSPMVMATPIWRRVSANFTSPWML